MSNKLKERLGRMARTLIFLFRYRSLKEGPVKPGKAIYLDISHNYYSRYLYLFLKFFHIEGYRIYITRRFRLINGIINDRYAAMLLQERIIVAGRPSIKKDVLTITDELLSPHYFSASHSVSLSHTFHIPMTQHPVMYHAGFWNEDIPAAKRKNSFFMIGNFDTGYDKIREDRLFNVMSRTGVYNYLYERSLVFPLVNKDDLLRFLDGGDDNKVILINRNVFDIPINELRTFLSKFNFFLALPGMVMPFSHNIVEAMSVGTIPFLQEEYASMFRPSLLDGINAITFKSSEDLVDKLQRALALSTDEILLLQKNVFEYYQDFLTPGSVVKQIENNRFQKIFLQAEHYSIELLKRDRSFT